MNSVHRDAFALDFHRYQKRLDRLLQQRSVAAADREDLIQETFLKCMGRYSTQPCPYALYRKTLLNLHVDSFRKKKSTQWIHDEDLLNSIPAPSPIDKKKLEPLFKAMEDILKNESPRAQVFYQHTFEGLTIREIARQKSCAAGTVASQIARFKEAFSRKMLHSGLADDFTEG